MNFKFIFEPCNRNDPIVWHQEAWTGGPQRLHYLDGLSEIMYTHVTSTVASVCMIRDGRALFLENEQGGEKCDPKSKLASHVVGPTPPQDHWMPRGNYWVMLQMTT